MSQMSDYENSVIWNPWHGCKRVSAGCANCYVYEQDKRYGRDTSVVTKGATTYALKAPIGSTVRLCFSSDFFIEDADIWRDGCWDEIRYRIDCKFIIPTKRPERIKECIPDDWGDGWDNVLIIASVENQEMADKRLAILCDAPVKHRGVFCAPLIDKVSLAEWLGTGLIEEVSVGGDNAYSYKARPLMYEWVFQIYRECRDRDVAFWFHQTGTIFIKDSMNFGESRHKKMISVANEFAEVLAEDYSKMNLQIDRIKQFVNDKRAHLLWQATEIEGLNLPEEDVAEIAKHGIIPGYDKKQVLFIYNMYDAFTFVCENVGWKNDIATLRELNQIVGDGLIHKPGSIRNSLVTISGTTWMPEIPTYESIVIGLNDLNNGIADATTYAVAMFCYVARGQFFNDGNKRVAQLIMNKILIENGVGVLWFDDVDEIQELMGLLVGYYETNNPTVLFSFLTKHIKHI